jgi:hypothetical protein
MINGKTFGLARAIVDTVREARGRLDLALFPRGKISSSIETSRLLRRL